MDDYLAHHGILGQKWGVRRYQNLDGSLTDAGKKRYAVDIAKSNVLEKSFLKNTISPEVQQEISKRISKNAKELKKLNDAENAPYEYEKKKLWDNNKAFEKYANRMVDDYIKLGYYTEADRKNALWAIKNDDAGQDLFERYYLPDHPKEAKEYSRLMEGFRDAWYRKQEIQDNIVSDVLGPYANMPVDYIQSMTDRLAGSYKFSPTTAGEILRVNVNKQIADI